MRTITRSRVFRLGGAAMIVLALAGAASASVTPVPEVDPATAAGGLALLAGGVLLLLGRRRKRD